MSKLSALEEAKDLAEILKEATEITKQLLEEKGKDTTSADAFLSIFDYVLSLSANDVHPRAVPNDAEARIKATLASLRYCAPESQVELVYEKLLWPYLQKINELTQQPVPVDMQPDTRLQEYLPSRYDRLFTRLNNEGWRPTKQGRFFVFEKEGVTDIDGHRIDIVLPATIGSDTKLYVEQAEVILDSTTTKEE